MLGQPPAGPRPDPPRAPELLLDVARQHPGELHVLATGPCSNLAAALRAEPDLPSLVASVTVMGGAVRVPGNVTPYAEANLAGDPAAIAAVLAAPWPVTLVPLDVTLQHRWTPADQEALATTPFNRALAAMLPVYFDFYRTRFGVPEIPLHDPLAAGIAVGELTPADAPSLGLRIDLTTGQVLEDPGATPPVRVVLSLTEPAGPIILRRLLEAE